MSKHINSPTPSEHMTLLHNNFNHLQPNRNLASNSARTTTTLHGRIQIVQKILLILLLLLLILCASLFSLHKVLQILQFETEHEREYAKQPVPVALLPEARPLVLQKHHQHQQQENQHKEIESPAQKRAFIRQMAQESWRAYLQDAWGHESVRPVTKEPYDYWFGTNASGRTIVAAASTLWILGLQHEYQQARNWIETKLQVVPVDSGVSLQFAVGEYLGGLLSCYALTGDLVYLDRAVELASSLKSAYVSPGGLLYQNLNLSNPSANSPIDYNIYLWIGVQSLEYLYLLELTGNCEYQKRLADIRKNIWLILEQNEAAPIETNYLLHYSKVYLQTQYEDHEAYKFYNKSLVRFKAVLDRSRTGLLYVKEFDLQAGTRQAYMEADSCCLATLIALGARLKNGTVLEQELHLAASLVETCREAARRSQTGLLPARFYFNDRDDATNGFGDQNFKQYFLNPELAEAYFILYRLTKNPKYRTYAWELAQSIYRHCQTESGAYSVIENVDDVPTEKVSHLGLYPDPRLDPLNQQPTYFLGATLKYLWLIFADEEVLPTEQWIFNAVGQPLPIKRTQTRSRCKL